MAKRRPAGDGMVRKRSDGRWEGRIVVGHKADGSPIVRSVFAKTQGELLKKLHSRIEEYRDVELTEESDMTLGQWLDKWLSDYMTLTVRESTLNSYKSITEHHIKPLLGDEKISSITTADIQKMYNWLRENGRVNEHYEKGNALSDSFIRRVHMMLHQALDAAVRERLIPKNPTEGTIIPKANYAPKQILTEEQLEKFMEVLKQDPLWFDLPVLIPYFLAGMDLARMTPVRFSRSPPIAEGIRRISSSPWETRRAASQDRKALFTSMWNIRRSMGSSSLTQWFP